VLSLLNQSFGPLRDSQGRVITNRFSLSQSASFAGRLSMMSRGFIPGFVWEESGRIVGNVTLLESPINGRYLVANVAVHPDYRRRGIARALMHEALGHIESWNGQNIYLQVESDNEAAIALYDSLAFEQRGDVRRWQASLSSLRLPAPEDATGPRARPLRGSEWRLARSLDRDGFAPDLNWPAPPPADYYKKGLLRKASDLLNGRRQETWVIDDKRDAAHPPIGLADIVSEWGRPHLLRLCVAPEWRGSLEGALLYTAVDRLHRFRNGAVWLNHPAGDDASEAMLRASNFYLRRSLTVMRKELRPRASIKNQTNY